MTSNVSRVLLLAASVLSMAAISGSDAHGAASNPGDVSRPSTDIIASAESAAPAALSHHATILGHDGSGKMKVLRRGTNGWTCTPDDPRTPGPDPACMDANAAKFGRAMMSHQPPPDGTPGLVYRLQGGATPSNTDPSAPMPTDPSRWVRTGPHVIVVGSKAMLAGYPSGPNPDTSAPYVMWAGTPYAHLMIPVGTR